MKIFQMLIYLVISLCVISCSVNETNVIDLNRIDFINQIAKYVDEYHSIKGYYPFANGEFKLPVCIYLNSNLKVVDYPIHYNHVTVYDFQKFIDELKNVLGEKIVIVNDSVENYKNPDMFISRYYCAGNTYLITANLSSQHNLANHNRFPPPKVRDIKNNSKITEFKYNPGFMWRYSIGSITNIDNFTYSLEDYHRLTKLNYKVPVPKKEFYEATRSKNYESVLSMIKDGTPVNPMHRNFNHVASPLIFAVRENDLKMAKILLENGANVNARGSYHDVVLIYAMAQKNVNYDLIELLIKSGANVNSPNFFGISPFVGACMTGNIRLVEFYIKNGANLNQDYFYFDNNVYKKGNTPLKAAIDGGHIDVVEILIQNGCEFKQGTPGNEITPIDFAKKLKRKKIVTLITKYL